MRTPRKFVSPARRPLRSSFRMRPSNRSTPMKLCPGCRRAYSARNEPSPLPSSTSSGWSAGKSLARSMRSIIEVSE